MGVDLDLGMDLPSNGITSASASASPPAVMASLWQPKPPVSRAPRPGAYNTCVHHMFEDRARVQPEAVAICAWDGRFTYTKLDALSTSLAAHLARHGVGPEVYVPICSEKSCWVPVAMLAVLKAGGAFVLLDPSHPMERLKWMCRVVGATSIVASNLTADMARQLAPEVFISSSHSHSLTESTAVAADVNPNNVAYAVFTSGSSGRPKGVAIEHRAFCSSAVAHAAAVGMSPESRVLQFASYAFDACLTEILTSLIAGACVCIPSGEGGISDLVEVRRLQPNWALLTPSVARIVDVADFSMLRTMVLGGEAINENDVRKWAPHLSLYVAYGVSEAAVVNLVRPCSVGDIDHANLGFGVGVECWLVEPDNHECLATVGAVGELVLGGPAIGREYVGDPTRTKAAFIDLPPGTTGDLCTYNPADGSIRYVGRKDDQQKFHGRRLEVAEVEHNLRNLLPDTRDLVVDVVKSNDMEILVAFVLLRAEASAQHVGTSEPWFLEASDGFRAQARLAQQQLEGSIPDWMIPGIFLPLKRIPLLPSGKSDRQKLRSLTATMTQHRLHSYRAPQMMTVKRAPSTPSEKLLQQLWSTVLRIPGSDIGLDDRFTELGGTSIHLMRLAGAARQQGVILALGDALRRGSLAAMAASLTPAPVGTAKPVQPFSLIPKSEDREGLIGQAVQICQLQDRRDIEDLYPCTPIQEGLMSLTARRPGAYTVAYEYDLPSDVHIQQFQRAWNTVVAANPILRTRFVQSVTGSMYQTVLRDILLWESDTNAKSSSRQAVTSDTWTLGRPLARLSLHQPGSGESPYRFGLSFHHALSDGWSLPLLLQQVQSAYVGTVSLPPRPFNRFIEYIARTRPDYEKFWNGYFTDLQAAAFPSLPSVIYTPNPTARKTFTVPADPYGNSEFSVPNRLKLAWSILISFYTDSPDTIFGLTVAGRGAPVLGIENMTGPTIASIPYRLHLQLDHTIADALLKIQGDYVTMMPFEQAGLQHISHMGPEAALACSAFQSHLVIQPPPDDPPALFRASRDLAGSDAFSTYAVNLICRQMTSSVEIDATFDPNVIDETQFGRMLQQMRHIFQQLNPSQSARIIRDLDVTSPEDWAELTAWNGALPEPVYACAHDLILNQSNLHPESPAVCAWDGDFTYGEIEKLSSSMAAYLMSQGVGPEIFIPLCFEKSRWTTIAMLAVIKAGGAFILLDPSHPVQRLQGICRDAKALFVISSEWNADLARELAPRSVIIGTDWKPWEFPETLQSLPNPAVSPENSMYAVFTSGSTGAPKGATHSHISWCTSAQANCVGLYLGPTSRVFQFAAYAFDISIADNLLTLVAGGCICVPKNEQIQNGNLVEAITDLDANWACLTPSVARIINPSRVSGLKKLVLCGEPIAPEVISLWSAHAHLLNLYGPAECAILTTLHRNVRDYREPNNIGFPTSAVCWVVDLQNEQRLAPIGTVGELLVESPIVGHGYLNSPERSAESFIPSEKYPMWLTKFRPQGKCRLYRTGDLVQYTNDGSLRYVSRSDTQIKLRGQRIELGEVEYHLRQCFPEVKDAVAEVITKKTGTKATALTAFILLTPRIFKISDRQFWTLSAEAIEKLKLVLPRYMVPSVFVPVDQLPYSKSGKLDRKLLRDLAAELPDEHARSIDTKKLMPISDKERVLQGLFAQALKIPSSNISTSENFMRLGGDSIVAMNLVALAKDVGIMFSVADIFKNPTISSLAMRVGRCTTNIDFHIPPFFLIQNHADPGEIEKAAMDQCRVNRDQIEDIYPCTALQEGLISLSAKISGMYIARFKYLIPPETDIPRFQRAWNQVVHANSILRTRIIQSGDNGTFQVVLKDIPQWKFFKTADEQDDDSEHEAMALGSQLLHLSMAPSEDGSGSHHFHLIIHHSLYDGWSFRLIWKQVLEAYQGHELLSRPFNRFIRDVGQIEGCQEFWKDRMGNLNAVQFPALPHVDYSLNPTQSFSHPIKNLPKSKGAHTLATMIQLSWAIVLSHYTDSDDVVFGVTFDGRSAAFNDITEITGPTIATVPVRVRLNSEKTVEDSLLELQEQTIAMIPFLQYGLRNISRINEDNAKGCDFQSQLVVQPPNITSGMNLEGLARAEQENLHDYKAFASYAFVMLCHMEESSNNLFISVNYDPEILQRREAQRLVEQFHGVLYQLFEKPTESIQEIELVSKEDMTQLAMWHDRLPSATPEALHDLVLEHCRSRPDEEAVSSWDGRLTYSQLDNLSARLAQHLLTLSLERESKVAVCLEKSCWSIVALLAVLRSGCTCVVVDPGHPRFRIEQMIGKATPELMLVSKTHEKLAHGLVSSIISVSSSFIQGLPLLSTILPTVAPNQAAFILFTSGSTGVPKGIVMEHINWSTSITQAGVEMNFTSQTRCLHFSSYAFDASLYEIFNTLGFGGCLCIVSEHDRMNNLAPFISEKRVNLAILTPSTVAFLQPEDVPSLQTLVVGGEALTYDLVGSWANKVTLVNAYGPAEGTICCVGKVPTTGWKHGTIGHMVGSHGWIVDRSNHMKLAAIGAVGELIIEGPVVTRGYIKEPEKTAAAYIQTPPWLLCFRSKGTEGRLYKSGDLVQYNLDGTIRFFGRIEGQVKLRGQRIELAEVEYHVRKLFPVIANVVAEVIVPPGEGRTPFLVACIHVGEQIPDNEESLFHEPTPSFRERAHEARLQLSNSIPSYMVPEAFLPLRRVPLSRGGKLDRRQIREACGLLSLDQIREYSTEATVTKRAPSTSIERTLQRIWAKVLNMEASSIGVDDNWMRLGGDSIQAMRVVAQCATAGLKTSVRALFHGKTIAQMSLRTEHIHSKILPVEPLDSLFDLSPIQRMFFHAARSHHNHFNQSLSFRLSNPIPSKMIQRAIRWIVENHSMFRARFIEAPKGLWRQMITSDIDGSYSYRENRIQSRDEAATLFKSDQESLDIQHGPLFICHLIHDAKENQQYLFFTAHHLIIDMVSWEIVLSDIEILLLGQRRPVPPSLSFQTWCRLQAEYAAKNITHDNISPDSAPFALADYWELDLRNNRWEDVIEEGFVLSEQETQALLGSANDALKTQPVDVLHAALLQAFARVFSDRLVPTVFSEGHGREPWDSNVDPSSTVGWFTTMWPADVSVRSEDSLFDIVRKTKDARRGAKDNGWIQFTSRYYRSNEALQSREFEPLEILFNYYPGFADDETSILQPFVFTTGELSQISPRLTRFSLIDVLAEVRGSQLSFNFIHNRHMRHQQLSIRDWIEETQRCLESASMILGRQTPSFTISDFPRLKYPSPEMETFIHSIVLPLAAKSLEIEDAYKCSPIQDGIMLSQAKNAGRYMDRFFWSVRSRNGSHVHPEKLKEAWQQVLQRHPLLRTVLYEEPGRNGHYNQLVLKTVPADMSVILSTSHAPGRRLENHKFDIPPLSPPHRLAICPSHTGYVECLLEINHAIIDGYSRQLFLRDLSLAYDNNLDTTPRQGYRDYVEYIDTYLIDEAKAYWERYLMSAEPCTLPSSPPRVMPQDTTQLCNFALPFGHTLREFCSQQELTPSNIFQLAWALVLRQYVNSESVCFGYMTSGRDAPIIGIDDIVGPIINMHICRVVMGPDETILGLLRKNQENYIESLIYQHLSITDKYDIVLNIGVLEHEIDVSWEYSATFISEEQVQNIADTFQQALLTIMSQLHQKATNINLFGALSKQQVCQYNKHEALPVDQRADQLIKKQCLAQPAAIAVDAWDGSFTYKDIDELSNFVAAELRRYGVGPSKFVPLCFARSRWTPVALLGVLKSGGAFILLDCSHPITRLQEICKDADASIVLASEGQSKLAAQLCSHILIVDEQVAAWGREASDPKEDSIWDEEDIAYLIFTSGSTGKPKGVMISHRALATSAISHGSAFLIDRCSRVLQFASYAFDAAVLEHVTSLIMGACVCIPSDTERYDIPKSVASLEANWVYLTPAVARALDPAHVKTIRTVAMGGEVVTEKDLDAWRNRVNLILNYGPTECTIISSAQPVNEEISDGRILGRCIGCCGWIANPHDSNQLVPVGAVGELLIEGPIVGLGYWKDPEKTADAFIDPPLWLIELRGNPTRHIYKTGDLVRYTNNGAIQFIGRKDLQVKLRGNRIELGEVETHLRASFPGIRDAVAEIVKPEGDDRQAMLVAFVYSGDCERRAEQAIGSDHTLETLFGRPSPEFSKQAQVMEAQMSKSLPAYMIPVVYLPLQYIPLTENGKLDRKKLRAMAALLSPQQLQQYDTSTNLHEMPTSVNELLLQKVWAGVLNKELESVSLHSNFFPGRRFNSSYAGSLAMQCIRFASSYPPEKANTPFELTPIQRVYFDAAPLGNHHFNQSFFLRITRSIGVEQLDSALHGVVKRHAMLRARFFQNEHSEWLQIITSSISTSYRYKQHALERIDSAGSILSESQLAIDPQQGPIMVADMITVTGSAQYLFIAAHHLVTDLVSWRIILRDLEHYLAEGSMPLAAPFPFQTWCTLQMEYAKANLDSDHARLDAHLAHPPNNYWGIDGKSNLVKDTLHSGFTLSEQATEILMGDANHSVQTKPVELFQAALIHSFAQTFQDRSPPTLWNEGHGREPWDSNIDLSGTVGWFTTMWPLNVAIENCNIVDITIRTKDQVRAVPSNGWAHFASSLHPKAAGSSKSRDLKEVTFNFTGAYQQLERSDSLFQVATRPLTSVSDGSEELARFSVIDVVVELKDSCLYFDFHFNKHAADQRPIAEWIANCEQSLLEMATRLPLEPLIFTLADFPLLSLNYNTLEKFATDTLVQHGIPTTNVEDAYPCSPIQRGILLSQAKDSRHYQTHIIWKMKSSDGSWVDTDRVIAAWRRIVARHPIFRTVFVNSVSQDDFVDQVVLKNIVAEPFTMAPSEENNLLSALSGQPKFAVCNGKLPYRFSIGQTLAGDVLCSLEISHALYDGITKQNVLHELERGYRGDLTSRPGPSYSDYISYIRNQSGALHLEYWTKYLNGVSPCYFPATNAKGEQGAEGTLQSIDVDVGDSSILRRFCKVNDLTVSNICQVAWGMVLKSYVNSDDICFGYLSAGRDISILHAHEAMGPFINMLVCRMDLSDSRPLMKTLQDNQHSFVDSLKHQHYPLANIFRAAELPRGKSLFNTAMSLQNVNHLHAGTGSSLELEVIAGNDPSEVDMNTSTLQRCSSSLLT
ncbi:hypothetical protein RRF57_000689 [Xylaria bambusicola]|uniref:Carrier domain-containing protein n=1 Tax=Xylaria bambusicola TaxID=326684 RepID=A0AAN7UAK5_9PEZI